MASGSVRVGVGGGTSLSALARDLRLAGAKSLRRELYRGLQKAGDPTIAKVRENASTLPSGGGRGRRRTRLVDTGATITNAVSGRTHKVKRRRAIGGALAQGESLAARVAGASYAVRTVNRAGAVGVRLVATERSGKSIDLYRLDRGEVRHPVFGKWRKGTPTQKVTPGWFTTPVEQNLDAFRRGIEDAVDAVAREIERG